MPQSPHQGSMASSSSTDSRPFVVEVPPNGAHHHPFDDEDELQNTKGPRDASQHSKDDSLSVPPADAFAFGAPTPILGPTCVRKRHKRVSIVEHGGLNLGAGSEGFGEHLTSQEQVTTFGPGCHPPEPLKTEGLPVSEVLTAIADRIVEMQGEMRRQVESIQTQQHSMAQTQNKLIKQLEQIRNGGGGELVGSTSTFMADKSMSSLGGLPASTPSAANGAPSMYGSRRTSGGVGSGSGGPSPGGGGGGGMRKRLNRHTTMAVSRPSLPPVPPRESPVPKQEPVIDFGSSDLLVQDISNPHFSVDDADGPAGDALALSLANSGRKPKRPPPVEADTASVAETVESLSISDTDSDDGKGQEGPQVMISVSDHSNNHLNVPGGRMPPAGSMQRQESTVSELNVSASDNMGATQRGGRRRRLPTADDPAKQKANYGTVGRDNIIVTTIDIAYIVIATITAVWVTLLLHAEVTNRHDNPHPATIVWFLLVEIFTAIFMVVTCFTRRRKSEWEVVDDPAEVRRLYFRSWWFYVDVICALPLEFAFLGWFNPAFNVLTARHFLRIFRVIPMHESTNPLLDARPWHTMVVITMGTILLAQMAAIIFLSVEDKGDSGDGDVIFVDALYWATSTITSVGYGDVVSTNRSSRAFSVVMQFAGVMVIALVTSVGTQFLTTKDPLQEEQQRRKKMMYSMLQFYDIPWDVQKEVIGLFPSVLSSASEDQFKEMVESLPNTVSEKIDHFLKEKMLNEFPLFKQMHDGPAIISAVAKVLKRRFIPAFEVIIQAGEMGEQMFFIVRGNVEITVPVNEEEEIFVASLKTGAWFGEVALMERSRRTATVSTITPSELMELSKDDFDNIVKTFPELKKRIMRQSTQQKDQNNKTIKQVEEMSASTSASSQRPGNPSSVKLESNDPDSPTSPEQPQMTRQTTAALFTRNAASAVFNPLGPQAAVGNGSGKKTSPLGDSTMTN